jgi:hypothetical protein
MGIVFLVVAVCALLALLPSMIAQEKGRPMGIWYLYSFGPLFPIALIHAFLLKSRPEMEKCPKCKKMISVLALQCPHCGYELIRDWTV